jgi:hypothetical protein
VSNATIIAAIDAAIESWAGKPVSMSVNGRTVTYRSLSELMEARKYYASLDASAGDIRDSFKIAQFKSGGTV